VQPDADQQEQQDEHDDAACFSASFSWSRFGDLNGSMKVGGLPMGSARGYSGNRMRQTA
jgi:hypothetical protein